MVCGHRLSDGGPGKAIRASLDGHRVGSALTRGRPPSRPPIQERGPRRRPPQNLEIERANDRNTPIFIGLQLLQEPLMRVLKSTKSRKTADLGLGG